MRFFLFLLLLGLPFFSLNSFAQKVGIGTNTPKAALDIESTTGGLLPPRMNAQQRNAIVNPQAGLIVWCLDCESTGALTFYNGTEWQSIASQSASQGGGNVPVTPVNLNSSYQYVSYRLVVKLTWDDVSTNETGYRIERKMNNGVYTFIGQVPANNNSFDDTTALQNVDYTYRIYSFNQSGYSPNYSNTSSIKACFSIGLIGSSDVKFPRLGSNRLNMPIYCFSYQALSGILPTSDQMLQIVADTTMVNEYNALNSTSLIPVQYQDISYNQISYLRNGKISDSFFLRIINPFWLNDSNAVHAIGFKINYAGNQCNSVDTTIKVMLYFGIEKALSNGYFYSPTAPRAITNLSKNISYLGYNSYLFDIGYFLNVTGYQVIFTIDSITNKINISQAPGSLPVVSFDNGLPTTNPGYVPQWPGSAECNNTYDPINRRFKVRYGYVGATGYRVVEEIIQH